MCLCPCACILCRRLSFSSYLFSVSGQLFLTEPIKLETRLMCPPRSSAAATFFICCQFIAAMMMIVKLPKARTVTTVNRIQSLYSNWQFSSASGCFQICEDFFEKFLLYRLPELAFPQRSSYYKEF